ncbi:hypothetical protein FACS1894203_4880 [Bacteroidia bacterium]|nr:hypothetical protein FACS1894203_4880 [Bacteroidia bacterium]
MNKEMSRQEMQEKLNLSDREHFRLNYLSPALEYGYIELKYPDSPNHPQQRYILTDKGKKLKNEIE